MLELVLLGSDGHSKGVNQLSVKKAAFQVFQFHRRRIVTVSLVSNFSFNNNGFGHCSAESIRQCYLKNNTELSKQIALYFQQPVRYVPGTRRSHLVLCQ